MRHCAPLESPWVWDRQRVAGCSHSGVHGTTGACLGPAEATRHRAEDPRGEGDVEKESPNLRAPDGVRERVDLGVELRLEAVDPCVHAVETRPEVTLDVAHVRAQM